MVINYDFQLREIKMLPLAILINSVIKAYAILTNEYLKLLNHFFPGY